MLPTLPHWSRLLSKSRVHLPVGKCFRLSSDRDFCIGKSQDGIIIRIDPNHGISFCHRTASAPPVNPSLQNKKAIGCAKSSSALLKLVTLIIVNYIINEHKMVVIKCNLRFCSCSKADEKASLCVTMPDIQRTPFLAFYTKN